MASHEPMRDSAGDFLDCNSCRDSNHVCLHLSDQEICCKKSESAPAITRMLAELPPFQKDEAVEGEQLSRYLIGSVRATVSFF